MKRIFFGVCIPIIVLGVVALALNMALGGGVIEYIHQHQIPNTNLTWYEYDVWGYVDDLRNSFRSIDQISLEMPSREWLELDRDFWERLGNNLALMLDYLIMVINLLLYPLRIGFYFIQIILNILGINTLQGSYENNPLKWLIDLTYVFKNLQIPYV